MTNSGQFKKGNTVSVGHGRPRINPILKELRQLSDEVKQLPSSLLSAIAEVESVTLKEARIPINQINDQLRLLAAGVLYLRERGKHE
ncbi:MULTISPECIES: hypothetical protein [unclassified Klebsiella]|uniref:hypothetical protein n=1 Tax=unclassified Klebsiella TaxID=2608929 RepID=UPI0015DC5BD1|nr:MULTISPECIES: hypothetical protein [unclassified Klebsiella]BBR59354.1 hypothetical protein WP4W18E05_27220 [Klebsiella sp. WP4-W18-ESBL-05]BBT71182.1 hypothetical protein WP8S18E06_24810 [Klebsiella sp. WP8-S18-ESBL-06]